MPTALLAEQAAYYRARAHEYDEWWQRLGRHDHGPEATQAWREETREVERALERFGPTDAVLELACGTGWWTERLARTATSLTCIDASPETIAINRQRIADAQLPAPTYIEADLFAWRPAQRYDVVFFSFWLSHVPPERFDAFWHTVGGALKPQGRVFFIDSRPDITSTARDHKMPGDDGIQERRLNDGRTFRIVKLYYDPAELSERLRDLGWRATCQNLALFPLRRSVAGVSGYIIQINNPHPFFAASPT